MRNLKSEIQPCSNCGLPLRVIEEQDDNVVTEDCTNCEKCDFWESLGFCDCYEGTRLLPKIKETLELCQSDNWRLNLDDLTLFILYWLDSKGYIEHGTTIRCSWRTTEGNTLLANIIKIVKLNKKEVEDADRQ